MAELRVVGPYRGPGERLTAETLAQQLPADWVLIANRSLPTQEHDDLDLTVVGRNLVFIVEDKHWGPTVKVAPGAWLVKGQPRENPTDRVSFLSRKLAGMLKNRVSGYPRRGHVVKSYVVLSHPKLTVDWSEAGPESDIVIGLGDAAQALLDEDSSASVSMGDARAATVAFLDGWKERAAVPKRIGIYKVNREITPLGRARVFAAHDDVKNFIYLRCYPMDGWGPGVEPENLIRRERNAIQKLAQSGRTLQSQPVVEDDFNRWFVVPIVQEPITSLDRLLSVQNPALSPSASAFDDVLEFVIDAFAGLQEIHQDGVIHRGVAPSRVALDAQGKVKFTDLYLARISGEITVAPSLNELADRGRPFRAPECRDFVDAATPASDAYSLALSLLWWLHGDLKAGPSDQAPPARSDFEVIGAVLRRSTAQGPADRPSIPTVLSDLRGMLGAVQVTFAPDQIVAGRYKIERALGEGGAAKSWLAVDQRVGDRRVLKQYGAAVSFEDAMKEYKSAARLQHERCARVWDINEDPPFLVTDFIDGESLRNASRVAIEPELYRRYALDVLDGLAYMHDHEFLHNDISPGNIIIEREKRACLIDFGHSRAKESQSIVRGTPNYSAPELASGQKTPRSDLYALGATFLWSMLGHSPFGQTDYGDLDKSTIRPLSDQDRAHLTPLGVVIAEQFHWLIAPDPSERPDSAREFADDLERAAVVDVGAGSALINPTVDLLRQLYRGSKLGNAGNRGLDSDFAKGTYVETLLDSKLTEDIIGGELDLVVLTGNPGDGKTSYLKQLYDYLADAGAIVLSEGLGGWVVETRQRTFAAVYDASEARDNKTSDDLVMEALAPVRAGVAHTALLAINDGRLRQFFRDNSDLYPDYYKAVTAGLNGTVPAEASRVAYVDLKRRSLAATANDPDGIAGRTLDTFTAGHRWTVCENCSARLVCPMLRNRSQLAGRGRKHLLNLVEISHLRRQRRATFRDFRSAAAWVITGDRGCADVHRAIDGGLDLRRGDDALHFDLAFDSRSTDYLIAEWSELDPSLLPVAALEREYRARDNGSEPWQRRDSLNRRAFFADLDGDADHLAEATPYRHLEQFQAALASDEAAQRLLPRILLGLSRLLGAFGYHGQQLALQDGAIDGWAVLREISADTFRLERRFSHSPYVEHQADELLLSHSSAHLILTLDSVELILRAANGELVNDAAANAIKLELSLLASKLMLHTASAAIIVNPAGVDQEISQIDGSLVLGSPA
jgi:serine/threonine protein kinase